MEAQVTSGGRVVAERREMSLSQAALAQAGGVTRQAIGAIESGRAQPGVTLALAIARTLNVSVEELFGGEADEEIALRAGEPPAQAGQRVVVATIGARRIVRRLDGPSLGSVPEPAGAIVIDARPRKTRVRALRNASRARKDRSSFPAATSALGCSCAISTRAEPAACGLRRAIKMRWPSLPRDGRTSPRFTVPRPNARRSAPVRRFDLANIEEGWLVARGNPRGFRGVRDLARRPRPGRPVSLLNCNSVP